MIKIDNLKLSKENKDILSEYKIELTAIKLKKIDTTVESYIEDIYKYLEYIEERGYFEVTVYASCRLQYNGGNNALNIGFTLRPTEFSFFPSW